MWFFAPPRAWHPLAAGGAGLVDVAGDRGRADEADGLHVGVLQQPVDGHLVALDDVEDAVGQPRLLPQVGHQQRRPRVALRGLEDERVAARDGDREHPHRHHGREVERGDPGDHAERLAQRERVDVGRDVLREAALEQVRDAAGELDDLQAARDLTEGVGVDLAVFGRDQGGEGVAVGVQQLPEPEEHVGALDQRRVPPGGEGGLRRRPPRRRRRRRRPAPPGRSPRRSPGCRRRRTARSRGRLR